MKKTVLLLLSVVFLFLACTQQKETKEEGVLYPVVENGKYGFMDKTGKLIIQAQFDNAYTFKEGLAGVNIGAAKKDAGYPEGGKWGFHR